MLSDHATIIGRMYGVGDPVDEMVLVARGEQGRVWRLDTDHGAFAIKGLGPMAGGASKEQFKFELEWAPDGTPRTDRMVLRKYDPVLRRHVDFREER